MPRTARIVDPEGVYHVICRGNNKATVFHDDRDRDVYKSILRHTKAALPFRLFHYVLMGNHVHLLAGLDPRAPLAAIMKKISQEYAQYHARRYGRVGHLWQDRFKSILVADDAYLLTCGIYIELNPVRAHVTASPGDHPWSSYGFYAFGDADDLVDEDPLFATLGLTDTERRRVYRRLCAQGTVPGG